MNYRFLEMLSFKKEYMPIINEMNKISYDSDVDIFNEKNWDNNLTLLKKLVIKGSEHRKMLRMVSIIIDIKVPESVWKHIGTYKFAVTFSSSVMHSIMKKKLIENDFNKPIPDFTLERLNKLIDDNNFNQVVNELPTGYLRRAFLYTNLEVLLSIIEQRYNHKLPEWRELTLFLNDIVEYYLDINWLEIVKIKKQQNNISKIMKEVGLLDT